MERHVVVSFGQEPEFELFCDPARASVHTVDDARAWLDRQFETLQCEVMTPTGKILLADKILSVARYAGQRRFATDQAWSNCFACSAALALNRESVRVDVADDSVRY